MNVYVISLEDNLPSEGNFDVMGVYVSVEKARSNLREDYEEMVKECDAGTFVSNYFKEHTDEVGDDYWIIRSNVDESIYMSEAIGEFTLE